MDPVFDEEQRHLSATHAKLAELEAATAARLDANLAEVQEFKSTMNDELSLDFDRGSADVDMETYAEYAVMNNVVDSFNIAVDIDTVKLERLRMLLRKPYFAKVTLKFPHRAEPRDIYLGGAGMSDEDHRQLVVDWRSPVAETYYNQETGPTSYIANGRTVEVDLLLRRQFDLDEDRLHSYFDTTVAIQDPLLLAALAERRSGQMQAITATIQKEQNRIIRHDDVPVLLVRGVAGSGKTSVMLQRIAYLLFQQRASLNADQVYLISPNPVFERYIKNVLPELGEKNPRIMLWSELMERLGPGDRTLGNDVDPDVLARIDACVAGFSLEPDDVEELRAGERCLLSAPQVWKTVQKHARRLPCGPRLAMLVEEDLAEKLRHRIDSLVDSDSVQNEMLLLDEDGMDRVFGRQIDPVTDEELRECARIYLDDLAAPVFERIERGGWLRIDRIGMRMLGQKSVSAAEWIYLKMALTGQVDEDAKFVMVDEVQDYSLTQLRVLMRYFARAHFLLLGDENQAIRPGTATFAQIRELFSRRGEVQECCLATSYRSSPEITELFAGLVGERAGMSISSVQRPGVKPRIRVCADLDEYRAALVEAAREGAGRPGLTAIIANDRRGAKWLARQLAEAMGQDAPTLMREGMALPEQGCVVIDLALAKGLEFDRAVVADARASEYPDDEAGLSRRRLYTAISRATQEVTVLAQGELTELLATAR